MVVDSERMEAQMQVQGEILAFGFAHERPTMLQIGPPPVEEVFGLSQAASRCFLRMTAPNWSQGIGPLGREALMQGWCMTMLQTGLMPPQLERVLTAQAQHHAEQRALQIQGEANRRAQGWDR